MSGATQQCPECRSPLRPCRCDRKREKKGFRKRSFLETHDDDPLVYGVLFERIRTAARTGVLCLLSGQVRDDTGEEHVCGDLWRATAHHSKTVGSGGDDLSCVAVCGTADDLVHGRKWGWSQDRVEATYDVDVAEVAREHVRFALREDAVDEEIRAAAKAAGVEW